MTGRDVGQAVLVALLWALCYPLISVAVVDAPPVAVAAVRALAAGALVLAYVGLTGRPWPSRRGLVAVAASGLCYTGVGFAGMFLAGSRVSPGIATVLANVQPLLAAGLGAIVLRESVRGRRAAGLAVSFAGIVIVAVPSATNSADSSVSGMSFIFLGALGVAVGNVLLKRLAGTVDPLVATGGQLLVGGLALVAVAGVEPTAWSGRISPSLVISVIALTVFGTALAAGLWFDLLRRHELVRLNLFSFLTPVLGLVLGALFFSERLRWLEWLGSAVVVVGLIVGSVSRGARAPVPELHDDRP